MHDVAAIIWSWGVLAAGDSGDSTFKVAIVTTAGVVIAAAITSYAATFQRKQQTPSTEPVPNPAPDRDNLVAQIREELLRRAESAERRAVTAENRVNTLEALCWDNGINPHTGERFAE